MRERCEVTTLVGLPPPLRGRVGERGKPRALTADLPRRINDDHAVRATRSATEQAAPLSLPLPRKGGGNPAAGALLTRAEASIELGMAR
ncbi:hypothetical protein XH93_06130 [Bradyrhizobium sp. CCBAU 51753]|nr:hypothetical protein XH93_06130 [Bradyrhizobium sp. CCBAU 51753]